MTTLELRPITLEGFLVVDGRSATGLPFGLPFSFDVSMGRPLISAAIARLLHGEATELVDESCCRYLPVLLRRG